MTLRELSKIYTDAKNPNVPEHCRPIYKFSDASANDLQKAIVAYSKVKGWFAERQGSEGRYRKGKEFTDVMGRKKEFGGMYLPGHNKGAADIKGIIKGRSIEIEVKHGKDRMRPEQLKYKERVEAAGGIYLVVKTFEDFIFQIQKYE